MQRVRFPRTHTHAETSSPRNPNPQVIKFEKLTLNPFRIVKFGRAMMHLTGSLDESELTQAGLAGSKLAGYRGLLSTAKRVGELLHSTLSDAPTAFYTVKTVDASTYKRFSPFNKWTYRGSLSAARTEGDTVSTDSKLDKVKGYFTGGRDLRSRFVTGLVRNDMLPENRMLESFAGGIMSASREIGARAKLNTLRVIRIGASATTHVGAPEEVFNPPVLGFERGEDTTVVMEGQRYPGEVYELNLNSTAA